MIKWLTVVLLSAVFIVLLAIQFGFVDPMSDSTNDKPLPDPQETEGAQDDWLIPPEGESVKTSARVKDQRFYWQEDGEWTPQFIFGVNLGATKPGLYPGDLSISYDEYLRWFRMMEELGVNVVRVYTAQGPQFYRAFLDHNQESDHALYLIHGVWVDESDVASYNDAYAQGDKIMTDLINDSRDIVDILHGNCTLPKRKGYASGTYTADVSPYVIGWILGTEWNPYFIMGTNEINPARSTYRGNYLYTISASPFEAFLCQVADMVIEYETVTYNMQRPLAFSNWVTTDPVNHPNNPHPDEDIAEVNVEHIKAQPTFLPGMFASYHAYPYYPDCFNYQKDYIGYVDPYGNVNPYRAYLRDLKMAHSMPILISELGIPTSRAKAHESLHMGFNQGMVSERDQGEMLLSMFRDLHEEGFAGGVVFSWQDEWFKHTWNTQMLDLPDRRAYWSDVQTNEQFFGLLAFDPGAEERICYIDGDFSDWEDTEPLLSQDGLSLRLQYDERYLYIMAEAKGMNLKREPLYIPIDTKADQGNGSYPARGLSFSRDVDFVLEIMGVNETRLVVDANYDPFYFTYAEQMGMLPVNKRNREKNRGVFSPIRLCINYPMSVPEGQDETLEVPFTGYETGIFVHGIANPAHEEYNSLADFYIKGERVEIAVPWQLLSVMDPSGKQIIDDFYRVHRISATDAEGFWLGITRGDGADTTFAPFDWEPWEKPTFHERLKESYDLLKDGMGKYLTGGGHE